MEEDWCPLLQVYCTGAPRKCKFVSIEDASRLAPRASRTAPRPQLGVSRVLFCSSVLNLAELVALRPDLARLRKVVYFHENQLAYPVREPKLRDYQFGYNNILTWLVFLHTAFLRSVPDYKPNCQDVLDRISPKCQVLHFPLVFSPLRCPSPRHGPLHIVWPHRWEHDKNPTEFFDVMFRLQESGSSFVLSVLGESYGEVPGLNLQISKKSCRMRLWSVSAIFEEAKTRLESHILYWGYQKNYIAYLKVLSEADVVVSTAIHEFYGVAM
ncbi:GTDC1 [Cordylochernes scorpioides]|uniref:tRNA-queuosine alpha-mannosyltransferase n=1 Tax=Cordylochernes scorpioides TaxID=51811 RepID=A0ABY6KF16_9ARAC|nr:GTDC1 [Cordylochernes scorpioides]